LLLFDGYLAYALAKALFASELDRVAKVLEKDAHVHKEEH